jgi:DNA-binding response OmpR family regulator
MSSKRLRIVPAGSQPARKTLRVLIADDDRDAATTLAVLLRAEGDEVNSVLRGDEVLPLVRLMRPDALILDINMPGMSGYAVAREIRERYGVAAPLMIAVSGVWTDTSERSLGREIGFDHYLVKPHQPGELFALLEPLRRGSSAAGSA